MAATQRLELRQGQSLVMTPQLQQAIKLLQLSNQELAAFVAQEVERNPLLENDEGEDGGATAGVALGPRETESAREVARAAEGAARSDTADLTRAEHLPGSQDEPLDADYESLYDNGYTDQWPGPYGAGGAAGTGAGGADPIKGAGAERLSGATSLRQHLQEQLQVDLRDPVDRVIGAHLIEMLDDAGYLAGDLGELAAALGCERSRVEATLKLVQRFDPPGVFARSLGECLALQLADRDRLDPAIAAMLEHLDLLARGDLAGLRRRCGVDEEDLSEMIAEIRSLNPKPAEPYDFPAAEPIVPDILMRADGEGGWIVELNGETLPRVLVNARYYATVAKQARGTTEKEYITTCFQTANWLVKALHQRATTILKVAREIVRQQDAFFRMGVHHLKPLILRDIAGAIEMHESTVSRVTTNKFMATPRGIYELKYFFTPAIGGVNGAAHSAEAVRQRIKAIIDAEPDLQVLSDDRIVELLRAGGIDIARRTVAKYREAMNIPSSVARRRQKALRR